MFSGWALREAPVSAWLGPAPFQIAETLFPLDAHLQGRDHSCGPGPQETARCRVPRGPPRPRGRAPPPRHGPRGRGCAVSCGDGRHLTAPSCSSDSPEHWLGGWQLPPDQCLGRRGAGLPPSPGLKSLIPGPRSGQDPTPTIRLRPGRASSGGKAQPNPLGAPRGPSRPEKHPQEPRGSEPRAPPWTAARPFLSERPPRNVHGQEASFFFLCLGENHT